MKVALDYRKEAKRAKRRHVLEILLVTLLIVVLAVMNVLLIVLSPLHYGGYAALDISLSILIVLALIFYFVNLYPLTRHYYAFYRHFNKVSCERPRLLTFVEEKEAKVIDGVKHRTLSFSHEEGLTTYTENIYILDNDDIRFEAGENVRLITYRNVLIEYERRGHAESL